MARHSRRHRSRTRKMRGGDSASTWGMKVNGPVDAQFNRVFGSEYANIPGNVIIGAQGQNIPPMSQIPTPAQLSLAQSGGKRKKRMGGDPMQIPSGVYARNLNPQGNPWQTLAQPPDPRMAYATGNVQPPFQVMGSQAFRPLSGGTRDDFYTEPFNRLTGAVKELAEALNQPVFPFAYLNKTIKQQGNASEGGRRRRTRRH
jgi:hypothetical protein